jgi:hypothetical protein
MPPKKSVTSPVHPGETERELWRPVRRVEDVLKVRIDLLQADIKKLLRTEPLDALARFSEFAESSEARWVELSARVAALEKKVEER